jgi:hypothetical protein
VLTFDEGPKFRPKTWKYDREGKRELTSQRKVFFVRQIFNEIANDTTFYLAYGRFHSARLLTDRPREAFLLNSLTADEKLAATTTAMECLTHAVPILADLPIATLLRIRGQQRDAFESYRNAITRITSDVLNRKGKLSKKEARDMLQAVIEPQLSHLEKEIRSERQRQRNRIAGGLGTLAAGVAIGAFGGFPVGVTGALAGVAAVAGGRLLGKAAEVACEHGANLRQQNDLYFLLRLLKEGPQL